MLLKFSLIIAISVMISQSQAEKLSLSAHDSLISKLESVIQLDAGSKRANDNMLKQSQLALRLADLYAERARLLSIDKEGQGDVLHKDQIEKDRQKSLSIYKQVLNQVKPEQKGRILLQSAHLNILLQNDKEAINLYEQILKTPAAYSDEAEAIAHIQLGDIYFQKGDFTASKKHFESALKIKENPRKAYSHYRKIWCEYNLGSSELAQQQMIALLKNKDLLKTKAGQEDISFKEDLSRDLATFMAKNDIEDGDIETLKNLSPDSVKQKNLVYLATELDRTAKKPSAVLVWKKIGTTQLSFEDKLEGQIKLTRIEYDLGHKEALLKEINKSSEMLTNSPCPKNPECAIGQQNLKKILTDWGKAEERNPSPEVILAFNQFSESFDDYEMSYWSAQSAQKRKLNKEAYDAYKRSALLLSKKSGKKDEKQERIFENSLVGMIEAGEKLNNNELKLNAYKMYLDLNPEGDKIHEVKYQIAHYFYEKNDFPKSQPIFYNLVNTEKATYSLRDKAAELYIDTLVVLKDDPQLEVDSLLFSRLFKDKYTYYLSIWRKSILNQSAKIINSENSSSEDYQKLWAKIDDQPLSLWPNEDRKKLLTNKELLSYKLKDLDKLEKTLKEFESITGLTADERLKLTNTKVWADEMRMDFDGALETLKYITPAKNNREDYYFKVAVLTELAKKNPSKEYLAYLKVAKDERRKQEVVYKLILLSSHPIKDFIKYKKTLKPNMPLFTSAALFAYEKTKDRQFAKLILSDKTFRNSFEGALLNHIQEFKDLAVLHNKITSLKIAGSSDRKLQKNLAQKIQLLNQLEKRTQKSVAQKDNTLQLITLAYLAHENAKLAQDIMLLPAPAQLNAEQKKMYQAQVQEKIAPFQQKSIAIKAKSNELWQQASEQNIFKELHSLSLDSEKPGAFLAKVEVTNLKTASQMVGFSKDPFIKFTEERHKMQEQAKSLEQSLARDPFNINDLEKYKSIKKELGDGLLVAYLDSRLSSLNQMGGK